MVGRCERDARGPRCGQEQIGCNTGKHVRPRGCDAGDTTNQSVQNHCESSCNENKCEGTARLFDCQTRHSSGVLPCEGERTSRDHSSKGIGTTRNRLEMCESVVRNTRGEQVLGNEVTDTLIKEGCKAVVVVVPMMFVSENHGYVTVCHGDDFVSCGSAAALDEVDRVLTAHFHTKILPRIGPTAFGGEVTEGKHLGRTIRWSPQGFEWESNNKHVEDMVEVCGLKTGIKGEHRRRSRMRREEDGKTSMTHRTRPMLRLSDKLQARGLYMSIDRPSLQFAMSMVMSGMSEPKVVHQLQVVRVARYVLQHPGETLLFGY